MTMLITYAKVKTVQKLNALACIAPFMDVSKN